MSPPPLREVQELLWKLIAAPEGVAKGIAGLEAAGEPAGERADAWIAGDERLGPRGRLDVYANMYFFRIRDAVAEDYPAVLKLLGGARWHNLMTDYLLTHPSTHWSLRHAGSRIPEVLKTHPLAAERPDLPDLARLERAVSDVFQQVDSAFPRGALAGVPPELWPDLRFTPAPSVHLVDVSFDVGPLRDALMEAAEGEPPPAVAAARAHTLLVWREDDVARHEEASEPLRALLSRERFGALCERLAPAEAAGLLEDALDRGLLSSFSL